MRHIAKILIAAFLYCACQSALAGGNATKVPNECIGPWQGYDFSWVYVPDDFDTYGSQAKKSSESTFQTQLSNSSASFCYDVALGLPYGSTTHNWRAFGYETSTGYDYTAWVNFYTQDDCETGVND